MQRSEFANSKIKDLRLQLGRRADSALRLDRRATPAGYDLDIVSDQDAIGQAAWLALAIPRGSLSALGHPNFGSRLHVLIGEELTVQTLTRARAYIREALRDDPRFKLLSVEIERHAADPGAFNVRIDVDPDIQLVLPVAELIDAAGRAIKGEAA